MNTRRDRIVSPPNVIRRSCCGVTIPARTWPGPIRFPHAQTCRNYRGGQP